MISVIMAILIIATIMYYILTAIEQISEEDKKQHKKFKKKQHKGFKNGNNKDIFL